LSLDLARQEENEVNKRLTVLAMLVVAIGGGSALLSTKAISQGGFPKGNIALQTVTPGYSQSGHANISGTFTAGQFRGNGQGLSNVDAASIGGVPISANALSMGQVLQFDGSSWRNASDGLTLPFAGTVNSAFDRFKVTATSANGNPIMGETTGMNSTALLGVTQANGGRGVLGVSNGATSGVGVYGTTEGTSGIAIQGRSYSQTGSTIGVLGYVYSPGGVGVLGGTSGDNGVCFEAESQSDGATGFKAVLTGGQGAVRGLLASVVSPAGIAVAASNLSTSGDALAGEFTSTASNNGVGLKSTGKSVGLIGYSPSFGGTGVQGEVAAGQLGAGVRGIVSSSGASGVVGINNGTTGSAYGVFGQTSSATNGWAVYANGRFGASGTKSFVIDHPQDPENKILAQYCVEGAEPLLSYSGSVRTDSRGYATVVLPDYVSEIGTDWRYQVSVIDEADSDEFVLAKVVKRLEGNRFKVRTSAPNVDVCWRLEGVRNDRWMRQYGAPTELEKSAADRGKYISPELYGNKPERSIFAGFAGTKKTAHR
jgi:hypothetical protein